MRPMIRRCLTFGVLLMSLVTARADGPADNLPDKVRPVPPRGIAIADADRTALGAGVDELGRQIDALRESLRRKPDLLRLLPDVQVYHKAVHDALEYGEFYKPAEFAVAKDLIRRGLERAGQLREGHAPWDSATGLVVRGYVSKIDGSVQPYGLVVPEVLPAGFAPSIPAGRLVPRPRREPERAELHRRPAEVARRVHPAQRVRAASVRAILQRQQVRRRDRPLRGARRHQEPLPDRRGPARDAGLLDGRRRLLAVRGPLPEQVGRRRAGCRLLRDRRLPQGLPEGAGEADLVRAEALAPLRLHRLRPEPLQLPDRRLQRRERRPEAGRRHDGQSPEGRRDRAGPRHRREGETPLHARGQGRDQSADRLDREARSRCGARSHVKFTTWTLRYNRSYWVQVDGLEQHWERARVEADLVGGDGRTPSDPDDECLGLDDLDPPRAVTRRASVPSSRRLHRRDRWR